MAYQAPTTKTTGTLITAAIWNQDVVDNQNAAFPLGVGAWTSFTPTLTQSGAVTKTTDAKYMRIGRTVHFKIKLIVTGSGTAANAVRVGLPVAAAAATDFFIGQGIIYDSSATLLYRALVTMADADEVFLSPTNSTVADVLGITQFTAGLASGDVVTLSGTYEAAT